jgi:transposase
LAFFCQQHNVELVALEATGGYEKKPFALLWAQGVPVAILNPRAVRDFAEGMGLLEKTDGLDARIVARFAEVKGSAPCVPLSAQQEHLKALVTASAAADANAGFAAESRIAGDGQDGASRAWRIARLLR